MNKLDLDISKYSANELRDIFNISQGIEPHEIQNHMNLFKHSIITYNNMSLGEKDNISRFIDNVVKKLADALDGTGISNSSINNGLDKYNFKFLGALIKNSNFSITQGTI